jgi:hypothetical protein
MWITAKVNDETVGTRINKHSPYGIIDTLDARDVGVEVETSNYADGFEAVKVENDEAGTRRCKLCSMEEDEAEGDTRRCPGQELCDDPECSCDEDSDHYGHVIEDVYMSWFEGAKVEVDEEHERVTVELRVAGKRFQMYVTRLSDDMPAPDGGALVLEVPGTDPNVLRPFGDSTTNRVIVGTERSQPEPA